MATGDHETFGAALSRCFADGEREHLPISANGLLHYRRNFSYLASAPKVERTWLGIAHHLKRAGFCPSGKDILDLGCGTGYTSIYFAMAGARRVIGLDLRQSKIEAFQSYIGHLPDETRRRIAAVRIGIEKAAYEDAFDLIYAQEAISHIVDDQLFSRLYRMLRKGGVLFIRDGNNEMCWRYRKRLHKYWERVEKGPAGKCYPDDIEFVYRDLRRDLIAKWFGDVVDGETIEMLADTTANLYGDGLREACEGYLKAGTRPASRYVYATPPIHPELGYYNERLFHPYRMREELLGIGFRSCRLGVPTGHSRGALTRMAFGVLPLWAQYRIQPSFVVLAQK